jgi:hypothetical protein
MFDSRHHGQVRAPDTTPSQALAIGVQSSPGRINNGRSGFDPCNTGIRSTRICFISSHMIVRARTPTASPQVGGCPQAPQRVDYNLSNPGTSKPYLRRRPYLIPPRWLSKRPGPPQIVVDAGIVETIEKNSPSPCRTVTRGEY